MSEDRSKGGLPGLGSMGALLLEMKFLDAETLGAALLAHRSAGCRLQTIFAEYGGSDEGHLADLMAQHLGLERVQVSDIHVASELLELVPRELAVKYGVLPVAVRRTSEAEYIHVAMSDPLDLVALEELGRTSGRRVRILVAGATQLDRAILSFYGPSVHTPPPASEKKTDDIPELARLHQPAPRASSRKDGKDLFDQDETGRLPMRSAPGTAGGVSVQAASGMSGQDGKTIRITRSKKSAVAEARAPIRSPKVQVGEHSVPKERGPSVASPRRGVATLPQSLSEHPDRERTLAMLSAAASAQESARSSMTTEYQGVASYAGLSRRKSSSNSEDTEGVTMLASKAAGLRSARAGSGPLELPVVPEDSVHPFEEPRDLSIPVGLERTDLIPVPELDGRFIPPEPDQHLVPPSTQALVGTSDIPESESAARARALDPSESQNSPVSEPSSEVDHMAATPLPDIVPGAPMLEESTGRLASRPVALGSGDPEKRRGETEGAEEPTNPNMTAPSLSELDPKTEVSRPRGTHPRSGSDTHPLEASRAEVLSALEEPVQVQGEEEGFGEIVFLEDAAAALVQSLMNREPVSHTERGQLILAVARLLLKKGILTESELVDELNRGSAPRGSS